MYGVADITPHLTAYAALALARSVDAGDFEVAEYHEALLRTTFKLGGRTNPRGYYLDVVIAGIPGTSLRAQLKSPNDLMRMDLEREYRAYRNDWFKLFEHKRPPLSCGPGARLSTPA